jgi:hypothetical protein
MSAYKERGTLCGGLIRLAAPLALGCVAAQSSAATLMPVTAENLCVTEGTLGPLTGTRLSVDSVKMRAYLNLATPQTIDAHFTYLGPTANEGRLGSGELRRQFGLKLRAQNACNLVYVMWRIEPESKLVVSVKMNGGLSTSAQCGNRGYRNIKPHRAAPIPVLKPGDTHALRAELSGAEMRVFIDNLPVWEGSLGPEVLGLDGPVGMRSDNARLQIELRAGEPLAGPSGHPTACPSSAAEAD